MGICSTEVSQCLIKINEIYSLSSTESIRKICFSGAPAKHSNALAMFRVSIKNTNTKLKKKKWIYLYLYLKRWDKWNPTTRMKLNYYLQCILTEFWAWVNEGISKNECVIMWSPDDCKRDLCGKYVTSSLSILFKINGTAACTTSVYHQFLELYVKTDVIANSNIKLHNIKGLQCHTLQLYAFLYLFVKI